MPRLLVIIASTRPGRVGLPVATWFSERVTAHGGFELEVVDLAKFELPFLNEAKHPRLADYHHEHTRVWSEIVARADAVVMVTAEYNYGYPAPLKNAIDYLHREWLYKPVGFVSYGGVAAGTRAVQQLKQVVTALSMTPSGPSVNIPFVAQFVKDGAIEPNDTMTEAAATMLDELIRLESAVRPLRQG